ncbi:hypothetical protein GYMLUDRAFT_265912 [Collybiopsis luxurians FD-317 M1]|uniref:Uncharacterized protein n=1 Tax=Collybiopsis luxurians FD-317 M1 TaxID=944289 RepID=A0A0D0ALY5_9AGAR|nr:hypothetical protein GYMLUDRAFT_265912 [Collybiopsis luxurians FD-317 M1]
MEVDRQEEKAVEDGEGNWNKIKDVEDGSMDAEMAEGDSIAIPANNSGDVLHILVHRLYMVRPLYSPFRLEQDRESNNDVSTPTLFSVTQDVSNDHASGRTIHDTTSRLRMPMQVDDYFSTAPPSTKEDQASKGSNKPFYQRQTSSTCMWAEDISDQTGSHGNAVRVDEARHQMLSEDRLSEWDASAQISEVKNAEVKDADLKMDEANQPTLIERDTVVPAAPNCPVDLPSATPVLSLSSFDSAPSSDDSYGFQNRFKGFYHHQFRHQTTQSSPYGENAFTLSPGTSLSSLQLLPASSGLKSSILQVGANNGGLLPAINLRGDEARARTVSAPSRRAPEMQVYPHERRTFPVDKTSASPAPWLTEDPNHVMHKSSLPLQHSGSRFGSVPPSTSSSPYVGSNPSFSAGAAKGSESSSVGPSTSITSNASSIGNVPPISKSPSLALPDSQPDSQKPDNYQVSKNAWAGNSEDDTSLNFTCPQTLHSDHSPQELSKFDEPLMEVLQDMGEQQMSLCQSLRQYVFVHAAVIEGALMIVDEERVQERQEMGMEVDGNVWT